MRSALAPLAAALALAAGASVVPASSAPTSAEGTVLPVELFDVATGAPTRLEAGARLLHVVVFATWCRPCEEELPLLAEWEARFGAGGYRLAIVALAQRQSRARLLEFAAQVKPPGHLYLDAAGNLERGLAVDGVPTHVLIDGEGRVRLRAGSLAEIDAAIVEGLLAGRAEPGGSR